MTDKVGTKENTEQNLQNPERVTKVANPAQALVHIQERYKGKIFIRSGIINLGTTPVDLSSTETEEVGVMARFHKPGTQNKLIISPLKEVFEQGTEATDWSNKEKDLITRLTQIDLDLPNNDVRNTFYSNLAVGMGAERTTIEFLVNEADKAPDESTIERLKYGILIYDPQFVREASENESYHGKDNYVVNAHDRSSAIKEIVVVESRN